MNTGAWLTHLLTRYEVDCVFSIPGVHTLELYRALGRSSLRTLTPRHEQGAGFMADGYARSTGKPGVCFIISGPGITNIITAMAQAWADSIPMLVISTVNSHGRMGSGDGWLHELPDQQSLVSGVCAFSHTLHTPAELPCVLARAFAVFDSARPRPVHIEIPINVLGMNIPDDLVPSPDARGKPAIRLNRPVGNQQDIADAAALITSANRPVILIGGGAKRANESVRQLAEEQDAPVVMTVNGRGILPANHPLAVGASASLPSVRKLVKDADVVVAIGTELGSTDYDFNEDGGFSIPGTLIRIDIDPQQLMRTIIPELAIVGDAQGTLEVLLPHLEPCETVGPPKKTSGIKRAANCMKEIQSSLSPRYARYVALLDIICEALPPAPIIVGDSTQIIYAGNSAFATALPSRYFNSATGFGTLGYALPAAIGAAIGAGDDSTVVAIVGDGGLLFTLGELASAIDAHVNLILIVHENGGYDEIKQFMLGENIEPVGVDLHEPDILQLATACGWTALAVTSLGHLSGMLSSAAVAQTPTLLLIKDHLFDG